MLVLGLAVTLGLYFIFKQSMLPKKDGLVTVPQDATPVYVVSSTPAEPAFVTTTTNTPRAVVTSTKAVSSSLPTRPVVLPPSNLKWGAYVGDGETNLADFEALVGKQVDIMADFEGFNNTFPLHLKPKVGQAGKTLLIFWEPSFGFDPIISGSQDNYIKKFAADAKNYGYPIILVPFDEMNLNEEGWGYGQNGNTADKFKTAWIRIHNLFADVKNVKFGLAYNNVSIPDVSGNRFSDYYPGSAYVDYIGVDGFNFDTPPLTFSQIFDTSMKQLATFGKPIYIFSMASVAGPDKAAWITDGLGLAIKKYSGLVGWIWFNQGGSPNWLVNSDPNSLQAFKEIIP